jgi:ATP-GRASP peptide maturase of grasp-with-spasm system
MKLCIIAGCNVHRINYDDRKLNISITDENANIITSFESFTVDKESSCWFRRAEMPLVHIKRRINDELKDDIEIFNYIERRQTYNALKLWVNNNCKCSSYLFYDGFNKVEVLLKASVIGIKVPDWLVTDKKTYAMDFARKYEFVASKSFVSFTFHNNKNSYKNLTKKLQLSEIQCFEDSFIPCFFQEYIDKKYEIRSFYFHGKFFTYAIFSQSNEKTAIDFRNYDNDTPNRCVPYKLSKNYSEKLDLLMKNLGLQTGSFDILVDKNDDYYFLEVNPVGQFGFGSYECNENIEEYIAKYLINM